MKFLLLPFFLSLFLVGGCLPSSDHGSIAIRSEFDPASVHFPEPADTAKSGTSLENPRFSCLVESHGEIWMKPYELNGRFFQPIANCTGFVQEGIASWYGSEFHGKKTSNGEVYDMDELTAAHKTLPLGIHIRVTNLENGKKLLLRINDRGPYVKDRVLDLSRAAARMLGYYDRGTASVRIEALGYIMKTGNEGQKSTRPLPLGASSPPYDPLETIAGSGPRAGEFRAQEVNPRYLIQVGAFESRAAAGLLLSRVRLGFPDAIMENSMVEGRNFYCVRLKNFSSRPEAENARLRLASMGFPNSLIVLEGFTKRA